MFNIFSWIGTDCHDKACEAGLTIMLVLIIALPFILGGALLIALVLALKKYLNAKKVGDNKGKKRSRNLVFLLIGIPLILFTVGVFESYLYERSKDQNVKNAGFTIYAPPGQKVDGEYLRQSDELTIPHVNMTIKTPQGEIDVIEAKTDQETAKLFIPPDACDIDELYEYLNVLGKKTKKIATIKCRLKNNLANDWTIMSSVVTGNFGNRTPYAAIKDNTIVVFHAYKSTAGEFAGSPAEAETYIIEFLKSAVPFDIKNLK